MVTFAENTCQSKYICIDHIVKKKFFLFVLIVFLQLMVLKILNIFWSYNYLHRYQLFHASLVASGWVTKLRRTNIGSSKVNHGSCRCSSESCYCRSKGTCANWKGMSHSTWSEILQWSLQHLWLCGVFLTVTFWIVYITLNGRLYY